MNGPQPISIDQLGNLSVDGAGRLYWHGQEVITTLSLPWGVNVAIIAGAIIAGLGLLWSIIRYWLDRAERRRGHP